MKKALTIFFMLTQFQVFANMANPVQEGTFMGRPFVNQHVDVLHEELFITIDELFETATFQVKYLIHSSKDGLKIPFLFYASEYLDSFEVWIDSIEVQVGEAYDFHMAEGSKFRDFSYFFEKRPHNEYDHVLIDDSPNGGFYVDLDDMIYFETDIPKGKHLITVFYRASKWTDGWDHVNKYSFRYALSPAKYWRSFGNLTVTVDAQAFPGNLGSNLGLPEKGGIDSIAVWNFSELPVEILEIQYDPPISKKAELLLRIHSGGILLITTVLLAILHIILIVRYRKKHLSKRFSPVAILGGILAPLLSLWIFNSSYGWIASAIGEHASKDYAGGYFILFVGPVMLLVYFIVAIILDQILRKAIQGRNL